MADFSGLHEVGASGSEVHVTPHFSLKYETETPKSQHQPLAFGSVSNPFVDWISIYQTHDSVDLPKFNDGAVMRYDANGLHECTTLKQARIQGSHESAVFIRCDGQTVHFQGNVSKFGRQDNVFGYDFQQCISRINALLAKFELPPFTPGKRMEVNSPDGWKVHYSHGARITRLDVTENFQTGSKENASHFMRWLATQQAPRIKTGVCGDGETVDFGRGSRRIYSKVYIKGPELRKHARKLKNPDNATQRAFDPYLEALADWCDSVGLVRFETTYKSTFLIDNQLQFLGGFDMAYLLKDFEERKQVFNRATLDVDQLTDLEPKLLSVYRMWQAGDDLSAKFKKATFYRHRARLLPFGVDIAIRSNVIQFQPKTRVITLGPVSPPVFYELPQPHELRLAA